MRKRGVTIHGSCSPILGCFGRAFWGSWVGCGFFFGLLVFLSSRFDFSVYVFFCPVSIIFYYSPVFNGPPAMSCWLVWLCYLPSSKVPQQDHSILSYLIFIYVIQSSPVPLQCLRLYFCKEGGRERERSELSERLWDHLAVPVLGPPNGPRTGAAAIYLVIGPDRFPGPKTVPEFHRFSIFKLPKS